MEDGFDVVSVGIEQEGAVVVRVVFGAQPGRSVVFGAEREAGAMKSVDLRPRVRAEGDVTRRGRLARFGGPYAQSRRVGQLGSQVATRFIRRA